MPEAGPKLPAGYGWQPGRGGDSPAATLRDRSALVEVMTAAYREQFPQQADLSHLETTVAAYFSATTPLWWLVTAGQQVGCLWLGRAADQGTGERYTHVFLLYVRPDCRRQGLGTALWQQAQDWARARGDRQLGLHVFAQNQGAQHFYSQQGCRTQSLLMIKKLV